MEEPEESSGMHEMIQGRADGSSVALNPIYGLECISFSVNGITE
jgi:hypothetical protein